MANPLGPVPLPTLDDQEFWEGCNREELVIQQCSDCGELRHLPRPMCPECHSMNYQWPVMSGKGVVHSFTVIHNPAHPALRDQVPYNVVLVELDEGPRVVSNIVGIPNEDIQVGMRVLVFFAEVEPGLKLPKFKRADERKGGV